MPTLGKPKPRFIKSVPKPANVGEAELSRAEPVYIAGLAEELAALEARIEALESA